MPLRVSNSGGSFKMPQMELITEHPIELPSSGYWQDICYSEDLSMFVAITGSSIFDISTSTNTNIAAYSTDGVNWTQSTLPTSALWTSVTYGNGKFVAVAYNSNISAYSTDGINWIQSTMPTSAEWNSITFAIVFDQPMFVAIANNSDMYIYSYDGISWEQASLPAYTFASEIIYGNDMFIIATPVTNGIAINHFGLLYSYDGINWATTETGGGIYTENSLSIAYDSGTYIVISDMGYIGISTDGIEFTYVSSFDYCMYCVTYGYGKFVAIAQDDSNRCIYSTNGSDWTQITMPTSGYWRSVIYGWGDGTGMFIAVGLGDNPVAISTDGINWTNSYQETTYQPLFTQRKDDDPDKDWEYHGNKIMTQDYTDIRDITTGESYLEQLRRITGEVL